VTIAGHESTFSLIATGDCIEPDYEWAVQSEIGSTVDQRGNYIAGKNPRVFEKAMDFVSVVDHANHNITATATITVVSCPLTLLYGENSEKTEVFRQFRKKVLNTTSIGKVIINLYCQLSPTITQTLDENPEFKEKTKKLIDDLLPLIKQLIE
jgi:hypothetical protein